MRADKKFEASGCWAKFRQIQKWIFGKKRAKFNKNIKTNVKECKATRGLSALVKILELRVQIVIDCSIIMCDDSQ